MRDDPDTAKMYEIYRQLYDRSNYDRSLAAAFMKRCHVVLEAQFGRFNHFSSVVEVGAGTGQHIGYLRHTFDRYVMTDLDEGMLSQALEKLSAGLRDKVEVSRQNAGKLEYPTGSFDRLIATHVLEHLPQPASILREWYRVVRPGGVLSIVLPCDPGWMWRLGRKLGPRRTAERAGLEYDYFMATEHVNSIFNLVTLIDFYFPDRHERWYPLRVPSPDLNLFYVCNIRVSANKGTD
jgi:phosphatidylethanolamine/phosphatidyl-N-methylethanolamine N-methyltransferase